MITTIASLLIRQSKCYGPSVLVRETGFLGTFGAQASGDQAKRRQNRLPISSQWVIFAIGFSSLQLHPGRAQPCPQAEFFSPIRHQSWGRDVLSFGLRRGAIPLLLRVYQICTGNVRLFHPNLAFTHAGFLDDCL